MTVHSFDFSTGAFAERAYTPSELAAIASQPPLPGPTPLEKIRALEREQLMPRAIRECMLMFMEDQFAPEALAVNHGYQAVKAFDNLLKDLRAQVPI